MTHETYILYRIACIEFWTIGFWEKHFLTFCNLFLSVINYKCSYLYLELYIVVFQMIHLILFDPLYLYGKKVEKSLIDKKVFMVFRDVENWVNFKKWHPILFYVHLPFNCLISLIFQNISRIPIMAMTGLPNEPFQFSLSHCMFVQI